MGKASSALVDFRPVTDPISSMTRGALGVFSQRLGEQLALEKVILHGFPQGRHLQWPEAKASA
jgi:hypothetical protein